MSEWGKKPKIIDEKEGVATLPESQQRITSVCQEITLFLLEKNDQYGDSALEPNRIFSQAKTDEQIKVRIDDKINRLVMGTDNLEKDEDILKDLIGYLLLLLVHGRYYK
tara:strand:- start:361 stop:687 length:327 start_codon:yes stop_codon:yes gene_type:complete